MNTSVLLFILALAIVVGGLFAFYRDSKRPLPKNLPPPLMEEGEDKEDS